MTIRASLGDLLWADATRLWDEVLLDRVRWLISAGGGRKLEIGAAVEAGEHPEFPRWVAEEIAADHLRENPAAYDQPATSSVSEEEEAKHWQAKRAKRPKVDKSTLPSWWLAAQWPANDLPLRELVLEEAEVLGRSRSSSKRASFLARDLGFVAAGDLIERSGKLPAMRLPTPEEKEVFREFLSDVRQKHPERGTRLEWRLALARLLGEPAWAQATAALRGDTAELDDLGRAFLAEIEARKSRRGDAVEVDAVEGDE